MPVCGQCSKASENLKKSFTRLEMIHVIAATSSMARNIQYGSGKATAEDRIVNNSVITKLLLALDNDTRNVMLEVVQRTTGMRITLGSCPHGILNVVS